jgi:hypothetical protein
MATACRAGASTTERRSRILSGGRSDAIRAPSSAKITQKSDAQSRGPPQNEGIPTPHPMRKIVWTFGLISGAVMAVFMAITVPFVGDHGTADLIVGYAGMVAAFLLVYFGVRSYRDNVLGGSIGFGRAFSAGILIAAISSLCYVATWEVIYYKFMPDFYTKYGQSMVERARTSGKSDAEVAKVRAAMDTMVKRVENPLFVTAATFAEPFPVGLVFALVSAGVLRRKRAERDHAFAPA